ncbi:MAG: hypothetical protein ACLSA6_16520 [Holdemania massiliensis]
MSNNEEQKKPAAAKKQKPAGSGTSKRPARTAKPDQPVKKKKKKTEAVLHHSPEGHTGGKQKLPICGIYPSSVFARLPSGREGRSILPISSFSIFCSNCF